MSKTMSATDARIHFGELMRHVTERQEPVFVERAGKLQVVVISVLNMKILLPKVQIQAGVTPFTKLRS